MEPAIGLGSAIVVAPVAAGRPRASATSSRSGPATTNAIFTHRIVDGRRSARRPLGPDEGRCERRHRTRRWSTRRRSSGRVRARDPARRLPPRAPVDPDRRPLPHRPRRHAARRRLAARVARARLGRPSRADDAPAQRPAPRRADRRPRPVGRVARWLSTGPAPRSAPADASPSRSPRRGPLRQRRDRWRAGRSPEPRRRARGLSRADVAAARPARSGSSPSCSRVAGDGGARRRSPASPSADASTKSDLDRHALPADGLAATGGTSASLDLDAERRRVRRPATRSGEAPRAAAATRSSARSRPARRPRRRDSPGSGTFYYVLRSVLPELAQRQQQRGERVDRVRPDVDRLQGRARRRRTRPTPAATATATRRTPATPASTTAAIATDASTGTTGRSASCSNAAQGPPPLPGLRPRRSRAASPRRRDRGPGRPRA